VLRSRLERLVDSAGAGAREGLQDAINHTDEILRIFEALLRIAAIDARTHRSAFADVDLSDVARNVAEIYEPLAEENDRKIVLEIGPDVHVHADRQLLAQALANLVDNALKHGAGPVTISLAREAATIRLTVSDRGPGVPPEERKRVLDRFYRGDRARATSGSGLGLALAASVVRLHGGTIELDDNAPGLRVEIVLPSDGVAPSLAPAIKSVVRT